MSEAAIARQARLILREARSKGELEQLTRRLLTIATAKALKLSEGDVREHKAVIKAAIEEVVNEPELVTEASGASSPPNKRKVPPPVASPVRKKTKWVSKPLISVSDDEVDGIAERVSSPSTKRTLPIPVASSAVKKAKRTSGQSKDDADNDPKNSPKTWEKRVSTVIVLNSVEDTDIDAKKPTKNHAAEDPAEKSESELSVLIDEPPKRKRKGSKNEGKEFKTSRKPKEKESLSKNEEIVKKYKSLVVACGVRKQWAKEFSDCPKESQQISHLKRLLADLGMSGRLSLEQAKAIREKRELAAELDDVISFEKSKGVHATSRAAAREKATYSASSRRNSSALEDSNEGESDDEGSNNDSSVNNSKVKARPPAKRPSAGRSIVDFLGNQSDSD